MFKLLLLIVLLTLMVPGRAAGAALEFETAVVKRYDHSNDRRSLLGVIPLYGCHVCPGMLQFNCSGPIPTLVAEALSLSNFQFQKPDLSDASKEPAYTITAKLSKPATRQEIDEMLGNLLRAKMGVRYHMEKRPIKAEFFTVASKELLAKLPESHDSIPVADEADSGPKGSPTQMFMQFTEIDMSNPLTPRNEVHINCKNINFHLFAELLYRYYHVPVIDQTGDTRRFNLSVLIVFGEGTGPAINLPDIQKLLRRYGISLQASDGMTDFLVIDHVDAEGTFIN